MTQPFCLRHFSDLRFTMLQDRGQGTRIDPSQRALRSSWLRPPLVRCVVPVGYRTCAWTAYLATNALCITIAGWFGFNAGSAVGANYLAGVALTNTQIAAAAAMFTWGIMVRGAAVVCRRSVSCLELLRLAAAAGDRLPQGLYGRWPLHGSCGPRHGLVAGGPCVADVEGRCSAGLPVGSCFFAC
jgi:hypothetical protein